MAEGAGSSMRQNYRDGVKLLLRVPNSSTPLIIHNSKMV